MFFESFELVFGNFESVKADWAPRLVGVYVQYGEGEGD